MAITSPKLTLPFTLGSGAILGQGDAPELWVLHTTDDVSNPSPTWIDATSKVRPFSSSRGRESELQEIDAGTATITLDNRTRTFDPVINANIRPFNRWWIRSQFAGETQDIFKGYADSYDQQWPGGMDAEAVVSLTDEFKVLALDALPTMNPPRDTYTELVDFDKPAAYWQMNDSSNTLAAKAKTGPDLIAPNGLSSSPNPAIVGSTDGHLILQAGTDNLQTNVEPGEILDMAGLGDYAFEFWFKPLGRPTTSADTLVRFPEVGTFSQLSLVFNTTGTLTATVRTNVPSSVSVTSGAVASAIWHHVVVSNEGANLQVIVDGVVSSTALANVINGPPDTGAAFAVGDTAGSEQQYGFAEMAVYRYGVINARFAAHYTAGTARGFDEQLGRDRTGAILDAVGSHAPRNIPLTNPANWVIRTFMHGQAPLEELRRAVRAEAPDGMFFTGRDGTLTYLGLSHRSYSPWNTVQATFDDDGTDLPYEDLDLDYSESCLVNEWNVTRESGLLQTASDGTSIARYFKRSQSLSDVPITTDAASLTMAQSLLAKHKDPMTRITSLTLTTAVPDVTAAALRLELGDRLRVFRTPPGGGARIDQTLHVQKIEVSGANDGKPWQIRLGVSPL
jgi:hypothetical protein